MKPIKLTMAAFGPYAERQIIDFSQLENRKMFVISGKTGSGKTTIFDAISFALYGKPSGDQRSAADMRSQFADPKQPTEVELLFELKGQAYVIRRAPQQEKPKARGKGTTMASATAELYKWAEDGRQVLIASNVRDTDEKMTELIGLEASQFRQILMIPQGEFQKLLIASSQDKEKILQKLFQTSFYKRVEEHLKEKADQLKQKAGKAADQQITLMKSIPSYSAEMEELLKQDDIQRKAVFKQLEADLKAMDHELKEIQSTQKKLGLKRDSLLGERERGIALNSQFDRLSRLLEQKDNLEKEKEDIQSLKELVEQGERAEKLLSYEMYYEKNKKTAALAAERKAEAEEKRKEANRLCEQASARLTEEQTFQPERDRKVKKLQQLEAMKESVFAYGSAVKEEEKAKHLLKETKESQNKLLNKEKEVSQKEQAAEETLRSLQTAAERLIQSEHDIEKFTSLVEQFEELKAAEKNLDEWEKKEKEAEKLAVKTAEEAARSLAVFRHLQMELQRGQAAFLASQLVEGEPCAVCGSIHHPSPATGDSFSADEEALKRAEENASKAEQENRQAEQEHTAASFSVENTLNEIKKLKAKLPADFSQEELEEKIQEAAQRRSKAKEDKKKKAEIEEQLQFCKQEQKQVQLQLDQIRLLEMTNHGAYVQAESQLSQLRQVIPENMRDTQWFLKEYQELEKETRENQARLDEAKEELQKQKASMQTAESILREREKASHEAVESLRDAEFTFFEKQKEAGFYSKETYESAKSIVPSLTQMKTAVKEYEEKQQQIRLQISELKNSVAGQSRVELEKLESDIQLLNDELAVWTDKAGAVTAQKKESIRIQHTVEKIAKQMAEVEDAYRLAGHLYHIAHGKNDLKVTFERYVLASFLEDIISAANTRLAGMTNGRFLLERQTERAKGNAQSGLDLLVFDQYTGSSRPVKTLSGGESFKAALALALGLAEVVQNHAGGVSLETMFVDEGFGTLDPESLDQAIETLMDIQADGRIVGIISHVPELKERIDARLEVRQSDSGSKAAFVFTSES